MSEGYFRSGSKIPKTWRIIDGGPEIEKSPPKLTIVRRECVPMVPYDRSITDVPQEGGKIIYFPEFDSPPPPIAS